MRRRSSLLALPARWLELVTLAVAAGAAAVCLSGAWGSPL